MKVSKVGGTKESSSTKRKARVAEEGSSFADNLRETKSTDAVEAISETAAVSGGDAVLAAQSVGDALDDEPVRRRLTEFADDVLERLDEFRLGILMGHFSKERLAELAQKLRQKRNESADPRLNELIQEIELRAEVEIAKFSRRT